MASAITYDYETEQAQLARQQQIADAMQATALSPINQNRAPGVKISPMEGIAKIAQAFMAQRQSNKIAGDRSALGERYKADLQSGIKNWQDSTAPQPVTTQGFVGPDGPSQELVQGNQVQPLPDRRKAIFEALSSNHPMLKELAMNEMRKPESGITAKDFLTHASADSIEAMARTNGLPGFTAKRKLESLTPGSVTVNDSGRIAEPLPMAGGQPGFETVKLDGDLYQKTATGLKKLDNAPKISIDNRAPGLIAENEYTKKLQSQRADVIGTSYKEAKDIPQMLATLNDAENALGAGIKSGILAEVSLGLAKAGKALGLPEVKPEIANSEQYKASMAQSVLKVIEKLKPASDTDVKFAREAAGGALTLDNETMNRLVQIAKGAGYTKLFQHSALVQSHMDAPGGQGTGVETFDVPFNFSETPDKFTVKGNVATPVLNYGAPAAKSGGGGGKPVAIEDYLRSKGVLK